MNVKQALAAAPLLRRVWRRLPAPLRVPVAIAAIVLWLLRRRGDDEDAAAVEAA